MRKVYVCSPLRGDYKQNIENAKAFSKIVVERGYLPITPHIYFTQFMDDTDATERILAIKMNIELLSICDELWIFGDKISKGMESEILLAERLHIPMKYIKVTSI